jgi:hypothetical protein
MMPKIKSKTQELEEEAETDRKFQLEVEKYQSKVEKEKAELFLSNIDK